MPPIFRISEYRRYNRAICTDQKNPSSRCYVPSNSINKHRFIRARDVRSALDKFCLFFVTPIVSLTSWYDFVTSLFPIRGHSPIEISTTACVSRRILIARIVWCRNCLLLLTVSLSPSEKEFRSREGTIVDFWVISRRCIRLSVMGVDLTLLFFFEQ